MLYTLNNKFINKVNQSFMQNFQLSIGWKKVSQENCGGVGKQTVQSSEYRINQLSLHLHGKGTCIKSV